MAQFIVLLGAAASLFGTIIYIRDIFRGKTKPNLVTWILWSAAPLIGSAAAFSVGVRWAALPTFVVGFGPLLVVISSLFKKNSIWHLTRFDYICGALSVLALILWALTKKPEAAIIFAIAADGLAALPTLKKCWQFPETETAAPYVLGLFNILTSFLVLRTYNFSELGFPIYNTFINIALSFAIYRKFFNRNIKHPNV